MPAPVSEPLVYLPLLLLLGIAAVAVAVAERRSRRALLADGGPWPDTERYAPPSQLRALGDRSGPPLPSPADVAGRGRRGGDRGRLRPGRRLRHGHPAADLRPPAGRDVRGHPPRRRPRPPHWHDRARPDAALECLQPAFAVLIVVALAVAAGRWWRRPTAAFLVPVLLFFNPMLWGVALYMDAGLNTVWQTDHYLGNITATHLAWHSVFLAGYLTVAVTGALAHHDRRPPFLTLAGVGVAALVIGDVVKLPSWWWLA